MRINLIARYFVVLGLFAQGSQALATKDLIPTSVRFREIIADDVSGTKALRVQVLVQNIGTEDVKATSGGLLVGAHWKLASVYGPSSGGSFVLGEEIRPGETGLMSFSVPLGGMTHCQRVKVIIDTARKIQSGPAAVFANDTRFLVARETGNPLMCALAPPNFN